MRIVFHRVLRTILATRKHPETLSPEMQVVLSKQEQEKVCCFDDERTQCHIPWAGFLFARLVVNRSAPVKERETERERERERERALSFQGKKRSVEGTKAKHVLEMSHAFIVSTNILAAGLNLTLNP